MSQILSSGGAGTLPVTVPKSFTTTAGNAIPALNILTLTNGNNFIFSGAGSAITGAVSLTPTFTTTYSTTFDTNVAAAGLTLSGTTLSADGTDANININITAKGTGKIVINELQLTTDLAATEGGTGTSTNTDHGVLIGRGASAIEATAAGGAGTILTGVAASNPTWTTSTYPSTCAKGDVLVASANNVIGVVNDVVNAGYVLTANAAAAPTFQVLPAGVTYASDAETIAGTVTNKAVAPSNLKAKLGLQTIHALPIGASDTAALNWLAVGANGETIMGSTGADCAWTSSPQFGGSITATNDISSTAGDIVSIGGSLISRDATNTATGPDLLFQKVRAAATIQSGDELGLARFTGYDGTQYITGAKITSTNSGTVAATRVAGDLKFYTHPDSAVALPSEPTLRMTIASTGATTIAAPDAGTGLSVSGGITATTGDVSITAGNLLLPTTNSTTAGSVKINGNIVLRNNDAITTTIFVGGAGAASTACSCGTGVGYQAMGQLTASMDYMTCVGYRAGYTAAFNSGYATYLGAQAGGTGGKFSTCIGYNAGSSSENNSHNVYINNVGAAEEHVIRIGTYGSGENQQNLAYIAGVLHGTNGLTADTGDITATSGNLKLPTSTSTVGQIQINSVRHFHNYGSNLFIGSNAGNFTATSANSVAIGTESGAIIKAAAGSTFLGYQAGKNCYDGRYSTYIGYQAGLGNNYNNSGTGFDIYNTFIGAGCGSVGSDNGNATTHTAVGGLAFQKLGQNSSGGVFIGYKAGYVIRGNHGGNTFVGTNSGYQMSGLGYPSQSGVSYNTLIGCNAGKNYVTGTASNICLGFDVTGPDTESNVIRIGTGTDATLRSGQIYIGTSGTHTASYIMGIYGVTPGGTQNIALVDSNGQFGSVATLPPSLGGAMTWTEVTGTTQVAAVDNGYITNNVALVTVTLPATATVGQKIAITGKGAGLWQLAQNAGQTIHFIGSDTTTGVTGYLAATVRYDCVEVQCITANTDWVVIRSSGNITIA